MNKILPLLLFASCSVLTTYAQPPSARSKAELARRQMMVLGLSDASVYAAKTTAAAARLSRQEEFNDYGKGYQLTDSGRFIYSGARHSSYDHNSLGYISLYNFDSGPSTDFRYMPPHPNNCDSFRVSHVSFDSLIHYSIDTAGGPLRLAHSEARMYNSDGSVNTASTRTYLSGGTVSGGYREVVTYNAGRISTVYFMRLNGTVYDTFSVRMIAYNAAGNAIVDSTASKAGGVYRPDTRTLYTYNAAGDYLTLTSQQYNAGLSSFVSTSRHTNTYYASGQLRTSFLERSPGSAMPLEPAQTDSFIYTPGVPGYTGYYVQGYFSTGAPSSLSVQIANHFAPNGLKDSMTFTNIYLGVITDLYGYKIVYNAAGDPASIIAYDLQTTPHTPIFGVNYIYESFDNNVGIHTNAPGFGNITISPNPTTGIITLRYPEAKPNTPISIRITNASGQPVHSETFTLQGTSQQLILGNEAAPGTYYLAVYDVKGMLLCTKTVLKR